MWRYPGWSAVRGGTSWHSPARQNPQGFVAITGHPLFAGSRADVQADRQGTCMVCGMQLQLTTVHPALCLCIRGCHADFTGMPQPGGLAALFQDAADACLKDAQREAAVSSSSIPAVVVKAGNIQDVPGGSSKLAVLPGSLATNGSNGGSTINQTSSISREDVASALVASAVYLQGLGSSSGSRQLVLEVKDGGPGSPPDSWEQLLEGVAVSAVAQ